MKLQMIYFPVRARQEPTLMVFAYARMPCEVLTPNDFYGKGWGEGAKDETPYGSLPVLIVDGKPLAQSGAIMRFAASLAKIVPSDPFEAALCDSVCEATNDLMLANPLVNMFRGDTFTEKKAAFFASCPTVLKNLAKQYKGPFFLGDSPYYCDFAVYHFLSHIKLLEPSALAGFPKADAFMAAVEALPGLSDYLAARPEPVDIGVSPKLASK